MATIIPKAPLNPSLVSTGKPTIGGDVTPPNKNLSKYNFEYATYPEDLFDSSNSYGNSYAIFYINVQNDSKIAKSSPTAFIADDEANKGISSQITKRTTTAGQLAVSAGAIGAAGGTIAGQILGIGSRTGQGALIGAGAAAVIANSKSDKVEIMSPIKSFDAIISRQTKRLKTAIALNVPNELSFRYGINWDTDNTAILSTGLEVGADLARSINDGVDGHPGNAISSLILSASDASISGVSALTGLAANPRKEQSMNGVDFRTHQFTYRFYVRSEKEAKTIERIIYQFKYHMHPEFKDDNDYIFLYPSEFDIEFYTNGEISKTLPKITTCVLSEMSTNYTPQSVFNQLRNGSIPEINLNLSFRELAILTKDEISKGY